MPTYQTAPHNQVKTRPEIAESILGPIEWKTAEHGFCKCPGEQLHTTPTGGKDFRVSINGAPTGKCFHSGCSSIVEEKNLELRRAIGKAEAGKDFNFKAFKESPERIAKQREKQEAEALQARAKASLQIILQECATTEEALIKSSPKPLDGDPRDDWKLLLGLFKPSDVVWIGTDTHDSGAGHEKNFRTASDWLLEKKAPGNFTCPATFKNNCNSRSNANVLARRFLVSESDSEQMTREQKLAVINWQKQFMTLRAVICTGGKSLHGWFEFPTDPKSLGALRVILPALECDPKMFTASQPARLPGAFRSDKNKLQTLLYLNPSK